MLATHMISLGIDVGGSSVKLALVEGERTIWKTQSEPYTHPTREQLAGAIRKSIAGRFDPARAAVGICVPGTRVGTGRNSPRISAGASGLRSNVSMCDGPP